MVGTRWDPRRWLREGLLSRPDRRRRLLPAAVVALAAVVLLAPLPVVLGGQRLAAFALLVTGGWVTVGRAGLLDLATAGIVGVGAYLGGVQMALVGWPVVVGVLLGAVGGALVGFLSAAVGGRVGGMVGALTSLAVGLGVVAVLQAWPAGGGVAGFHAIPLLTRSARLDLAVMLVVLAGGLAAATRFAGSVTAARASVAVRSPVTAAAMGVSPVRSAAVAGLVGGGLLGAAGALQAALTGSAIPAAYGLALAVTVALAVAVGGSPPWGPVVGAGLLWGPSVLFPLAPVVGGAPPLLVMGPVGLGLLALRDGRPLIRPPRPRDRGEQPGDGGGVQPDAEPGQDRVGPPRPATSPARLEVRGARLPAGTVDLTVGPGEVVAVVGPNGAGKSTLLAQIGGQQSRTGRVDLRGEPPPRGALATARRGVARTFQHPSDVPPDDGAAVCARGPEGRAAARWAAELLGADATGPEGRQLVWLSARRPALALADEPAAAVDPEAAGRLLRGLADGGAAVLVVEHRPELVRTADRVVRLGGDAEEVGA